MKTFIPILALLGIMVSPILAEPETESRLFIFGVDASPFIGLPSPQHYDFFVKWSQLPPRVPWNAGVEDFPLDLRAEARRAADFLANQFTNRTDLQQVIIRRLNLPGHLAIAQGKDVKDFTNHWFVEFMLSVMPGLEYRSVVSLLDGSYAEERGSDTRLGMRLFAESSNASSKQTPKPTAQESIAMESNPYARVRESDIPLPTVQWNPLVSNFPLDLSAHISRSRSYLAKERSLNEKSLLPTQISLSRFVPAGAVAAKNLNLADHFHHWLCVVKFCQESERKAFDVYTFLDGTVLETLPTYY